MDGRTRQVVSGGVAAGFEQQFDLPHRAARVVLFGVENQRLQRCRNLGVTGIGALLGGETGNAVTAVLVKPRLNGAFGQIAAAGFGNGVLALCQLADDLLLFATFQLRTAYQRPQYG